MKVDLNRALDVISAYNARVGAALSVLPPSWEIYQVKTSLDVAESEARASLSDFSFTAEVTPTDANPSLTIDLQTSTISDAHADDATPAPAVTAPPSVTIDLNQNAAQTAT